MKKLRVITVFLCLCLALQSCKTIRELVAFSKSEFRLDKVTNLNMNGINLLNINSFSDINLADVAKLGLAFKNGSLPLNLTFNIEARNPNESTAALETVNWILELDDNEILNGTSSDRVEVAPNGGVTSFPISTNLDVKKVLSGESLKSIVNIVSAVKGDNPEESRIRLKIKPSVRVLGTRVGYPGYIKLGKTFKAE